MTLRVFVFLISNLFLLIYLNDSFSVSAATQNVLLSFYWNLTNVNFFLLVSFFTLYSLHRTHVKFKFVQIEQFKIAQHVIPKMQQILNETTECGKLD
jgi:hypothetical protein